MVDMTAIFGFAQAPIQTEIVEGKAIASLGYFIGC